MKVDAISFNDPETIFRDETLNYLIKNPFSTALTVLINSPFTTALDVLINSPFTAALNGPVFRQSERELLLGEQ
ncbi:hypothetical protein PG987_005695 [Apiospora arundinis]